MTQLIGKRIMLLEDDRVPGVFVSDTTFRNGLGCGTTSERRVASAQRHRPAHAITDNRRL